jgi:hypothetical protein
MSRLGFLALGMAEVERLSRERDLVLDLTLAEVLALGRTVFDRHVAETRDRYGEQAGAETAGHGPELAAILDQFRDRLDPSSPHYRAPEVRPDPVRDAELALVRRHNLCLVVCHDLGRLDSCAYHGLKLDQRRGLGKPILHLDPFPEGDPGPGLCQTPRSDQDNNGARDALSKAPERTELGNPDIIRTGQGWLPAPRPAQKPRRTIVA